MKKLSIFIVSILVFALSTAFTRVGEFDEISLAMKLADAKELARFMNSSIELTLLDEQGSFSKAQAERVIKAFFDKKIVKSFEMIHTGYASGSTLFAIGILRTENGNFRTYFFAKEFAGSMYLKEIRFESERTVTANK